MPHNPMTGFRYFLQGFAWLNRPKIRPYVIIPLIINVLVYCLVIWAGIHYFSQLTHWVEGMLPSWLAWLSWLMWLIFILSGLLVMVYTFTLVANLIGAPFNGFLAEQVILQAGGQLPAPSSWHHVVKEVPRSLLREGRKILYYLPRAILLLILFIVPIVHVVAGVLWFLFNGWMMAVEYVDYPMDVEGIDFPTLQKTLRRYRGMGLGFGLGVMLFALIPIVNFFVMPAAVCGASLMWLREFEHSDSKR
ncbi:MAG: sulfate transporter CysZ [Legionellales bacterium]|nr:sulfate transporter CysZ [Legionellales bacterium]